MTALPVWVISTTSNDAPTVVYAAELLWCKPSVVKYLYEERSYEVVMDDTRIRPRVGDEEPPQPWGEVLWVDIKSLCFRNDPRKLAKYRCWALPFGAEA